MCNVSSESFSLWLTSKLICMIWFPGLEQSKHKTHFEHRWKSELEKMTNHADDGAGNLRLTLAFSGWTRRGHE